MYLPSHFEGDEEAAFELIRAFPLAQVVVSTTDGLLASPIPMLRRGDSLVGHVSRANPIWRAEGDALAIFTGRDGYVSPRWLESKKIDGKVVPTWNYTTVHVRCRLVAHDDSPWKLDLVSLMTDHFEAGVAAPWAVTDAPADYIDSRLRGIVGIELADLDIECKLKLSQNRSEIEQAAIQAEIGFGALI